MRFIFSDLSYSNLWFILTNENRAEDRFNIIFFVFVYTHIVVTFYIVFVIVSVIGNRECGMNQARYVLVSVFRCVVVLCLVRSVGKD